MSEQPHYSQKSRSIASSYSAAFIPKAPLLLDIESPCGWTIGVFHRLAKFKRSKVGGSDHFQNFSKIIHFLQIISSFFVSSTTPLKIIHRQDSDKMRCSFTKIFTWGNAEKIDRLWFQKTREGIDKLDQEPWKCCDNNIVPMIGNRRNLHQSSYRRIKGFVDWKVLRAARRNNGVNLQEVPVVWNLQRSAAERVKQRTRKCEEKMRLSTVERFMKRHTECSEMVKIAHACLVIVPLSGSGPQHPIKNACMNFEI